MDGVIAVADRPVVVGGSDGDGGRIHKRTCHSKRTDLVAPELNEKNKNFS